MAPRLPSLRPPAAFAGADPQVGALVGLLAAGTALVTLGAVLVVGVMGLVLPLAVAGLLACVRWPAIPVGVLVFLGVVFDQVVGAGKGPLAEQLYTGIGGFSPYELLVYLAVACVTLDCVRRRRLPPLPWEVGAALLLLAVAFVTGSVVGYFAGAGVMDQIDGWRNVLPMIVGAPLVAAVLPAQRVRAVLLIVAVLIIVKAVTAVGLTAANGGGIDGIVFYEVTANWLFLLYLLVALAAWVKGASLPWWVWAAVPLVSVAFVVGLKRSLWLGGIVGIAMVLVIGLSRLGRRLAAPAVVVAGALVWILLSSGVSTSLQGPVGERVSSLNPNSLQANAQDRYRLDERANVWAELKRQPLTGLGQGVEWRAIYPLGIEHEDARNYVHNAVMWFWMKYTLLGALGYLALFLAATIVGVRVSRRHPVPQIAAVGLGTAAAIVSLGVAEVAGTWTGADSRFTLILGAAIGLIGVTDRASARPRDPAGADDG